MSLHALLFLAGSFLLAADPPKGAITKELDKLQGVWRIVSHEQDGKVVATEKEAQVTVTGESFTTKVGDQILRAGTLKVTPTQEPKAIDATYSAGPFKGKTLHGVYTLTGDTWTILYSLPGKERPRTLADKAGAGQLRLVLKRAKS